MPPIIYSLGCAGLLTASSNDLTPLGEQVTVSTLQPSGPQDETYYAINYVQPVGTDDMLDKLNWSDYRAQPENTALESLEYQARYQTKTVRAGGSLSYPVILDNTHSLTVTGGAYAAENTQEYTCSVPATPMSIKLSSQVRLLSAEASWTDVKQGPDKL